MHEMLDAQSRTKEKAVEHNESTSKALAAATLMRLPANALAPNPDQPRTYFDQEEMQQLCATIRAEGGILQSLLVRKRDSLPYTIIAGERRWRAVQSVFGVDHEVPVMIVECDDATTERLAAIENMQRASMSPVDEARALARELPKFQGDRDALCQHMGLKPAYVDQRLSLLNCTVDVQKALSERRIKLGHAELFAVVPKERQDTALASMLKLPKLPSLEEFKEMVQKISKTFVGAIFNMDACAGCFHNSTNQGALFGEVVAAGYCTNGPCYAKKTTEAIEQIAAGLKDEYPRVSVVHPGDNFTVVRLVVDGPTGVGQEQATACRACAKFGAAVSALPGTEGKVSRGQCFDPACNAKKVLELQRATAPSVGAAKKASGSTMTPNAPVSKEPAPVKAPITATHETTGVKEWRSRYWRKTLIRFIEQADPVEQLRICLTLGLSEQLRHIDAQSVASSWAEAGETPSASVGHLAEIESCYVAAQQLPEKGLNKMLVTLLASSILRIEERRIVALMKTLKINVASYFECEDLSSFLQMLTKSEIAFVAAQIGLTAAIGEKKPLDALKKNDLITALTSVKGFQYLGAIPKVLELPS